MAVVRFKWGWPSTATPAQPPLVRAKAREFRATAVPSHALSTSSSSFLNNKLEIVVASCYSRLAYFICFTIKHSEHLLWDTVRYSSLGHFQGTGSSATARAWHCGDDKGVTEWLRGGPSQSYEWKQATATIQLILYYLRKSNQLLWFRLHYYKMRTMLSIS